MEEDKILGTIPENERIFEAGLKGEELDLDLERVGELANFLEEIN